VVSALIEDGLLPLNRATGVIRRRNLPISSVSLGPTGRPGTLRLTCVVTSDRAATDRMANALRKMTEVRAVNVHAEGDCLVREHALVRVRVSPAQLSALLDAVSLFDAAVIEECPNDLLLEATGAAPFMTSFLRALEPFGIIDLARGGALVLPRQAAPGAAGSPRPAAATPRVTAAVPA
jgi:acetolactate synthase-1/3 small subunit